MTVDEKFRVQAEGSLRRYRTELPNVVFDMKLSWAEFVLYAHYCRITGWQGRCWMSMSSLAEKTGISRPKLIQARDSLEERGLIRVERPSGPRRPATIYVVDIWEDNFRFFSEKRDDDGDGSSGAPPEPPEKKPRCQNIDNEPDSRSQNIDNEEESRCQNIDSRCQNIDNACQNIDTKKEPYKKNHIRNNNGDAYASPTPPPAESSEGNIKDRQRDYIAYLTARTKRLYPDAPPFDEPFKKRLAGELAGMIRRDVPHRDIILSLDRLADSAAPPRRHPSGRPLYLFEAWKQVREEDDYRETKRRRELEDIRILEDGTIQQFMPGTGWVRITTLGG